MSNARYDSCDALARAHHGLSGAEAIGLSSLDQVIRLLKAARETYNLADKQVSSGSLVVACALQIVASAKLSRAIGMLQVVREDEERRRGK